LARPFDLADVGLPLVRMSGDGEHRDIGAGGIEDKADHMGVGVLAGQCEDPGAIDVGPDLLGSDLALPDPVVEPSEG
jgi:hypothetical protein